MSVPIGVHQAVVQDHYLGSTKEDGGGSWYLAITFACPEIDGAPTIQGQLWLTDKAITKTTQRLKEVFGHNIRSKEDVLALHTGDALVGKPAKITVADEPDQNGTMRRVVQWINHPNDTGGRKKASSGAAEVFAQRWSAIASSLGGNSFGLPTAVPADADVPF